MTDTTKLINDGGPAYPGVAGESGFGHSTSVTYPDGSVRSWIDHNQGMSLRDYFAAAFISGPMAEKTFGILCNSSSPEDAVPFLATLAYQLADAILAARNENHDD